MTTHRPQDVGILAIEMYFPRRVRLFFQLFRLFLLIPPSPGPSRRLPINSASPKKP